MISNILKSRRNASTSQSHNIINMRTTRPAILLTAILAIGLSVAAIAQNPHEAAIRQTLIDYIDISNEQDFEGIVDMMYPKLFDLAPKELIAQQMRSSFEEAGMSMYIDSINILNISAPFEYKGESFQLIDYLMEMDMAFDTTGKDESFWGMMQLAMQAQFGEENVSLNPDRSIHVKGERSMFMILLDDQKTWTLLENRAGQEEMLKNFFPAAVIKHFEIE